MRALLALPSIIKLFAMLGTTKNIQCDEIWAFCYAKQKNVLLAKEPVEGAGDIWTWTAIETATKLIVSWDVGNRDGDTAALFIHWISKKRLANRVQLTTDGHKAYLEAVECCFWCRYRLCHAREALWSNQKILRSGIVLRSA